MPSIQGVVVYLLKYIADDRGAVMHFIKSDSPAFTTFGEVYFSLIDVGVRKGLKVHTEATGNLAVPVGQVRFTLIDKRKDSPTFGEIQEEVLSAPNEYKLLSIPPGVAYAWENLSDSPSVVANYSTIVWRADESVTLPLEELGV